VEVNGRFKSERVTETFAQSGCRADKTDFERKGVAHGGSTLVERRREGVLLRKRTVDGVVKAAMWHDSFI
jgi:hypothetical protein